MGEGEPSNQVRDEPHSRPRTQAAAAQLSTAESRHQRPIALIVLEVVLGGVLGFVLMSFTALGDDDMLSGLLGQEKRAKALVTEHWSALAGQHWKRAYGHLATNDARPSWNEFVDGQKRNPLKDSKPKLNVDSISFDRATVSISGSKMQHVAGCHTLKGTYELERSGLFLLGGTWTIRDKRIERETPLSKKAAANAKLDCRSNRELLSAYEKPVSPVLFQTVATSSREGFAPVNLVDNKSRTGWRDAGEKPIEAVTFHLEHPLAIVKVSLKNGIGDITRHDWLNTRRVTEIAVITDKTPAGERWTVDSSKASWQHFYLHARQKVERVTLNIRDWTDCSIPGVAISEVRLWQAEKDLKSEAQGVQRRVERLRRAPTDRAARASSSHYCRSPSVASTVHTAASSETAIQPP